eukprot:4856408-Prymnesium_polylepis.1
MASALFEHNGTQLAWALPPRSPPRALLVAAHGCRASGRVWFAQSPEFGTPLRSPLPEESCITARALDAGFAVLAPSAAADCWRGEDIGRVRAAIAAWRSLRPALPLDLPLFAIGPSSGGWFAGQAGRHWADVAAVSMTVMAMPVADIQPPLPRGS